MNRHTKHLIALAAVAAAAFAGSASAATTSQEVWFGAQPAAQGAPLSRAEVQADLNLWNRAGLGSINSGEYSDVTSPAYAQRLATYQRLRSGPEYVAEVQRLGGSVSTAGAAAQHSVN
ncbi:DUF4148 domain-containing protein [Paracidovorax wautersii]|uniref:DUF4148 domain-containing protein n=1 Tax=Paracidovorax wautersii TaxID=1177982 RepID=UPI0031D34C20